jgi:hypothetical protein
MAQVYKIDDALKYMILELADHHCQCNVGHICRTRVTRISDFVADTNPEIQIRESHKVRAKALCKKCINKGHHLHLQFLPSEPVVKVTEGAFGHRILSAGR